MTAIKGKLIWRLTAFKLSGALTIYNCPGHGAPHLFSKSPAKGFIPLHSLISPRPVCFSRN